MKAKSDISKGIQIIPLKPPAPDLEEIDLDGDVETERTTASIKSTNTPNNNPFDSDDNDEKPMRESTGDSKDTEAVKIPRKESTDGPVKRFFNEIKDISCKNSNTAVESKVSKRIKINSESKFTQIAHSFIFPVEPEMHNMKNQSMDDIIRDNKTSKVCTIL